MDDIPNIKKNGMVTDTKKLLPRNISSYINMKGTDTLFKIQFLLSCQMYILIWVLIHQVYLKLFVICIYLGKGTTIKCSTIKREFF